MTLPILGMSVKHLNKIEGFAWATKPRSGDDPFAKVSICGESFWLKDCAELGEGVYWGVVDNELVATDLHGLSLGDRVVFVPTEGK